MEDNPYFWVEIPEKDFIAQNPHIITPYPSSHPRRQRLNLWLEAIHREIMRLNPNLAAPKPQVLLIKDEEPNAFVATSQVCLPVEIDFSGGDFSGEITTEDLVISPLNPGFSMEPRPIFQKNSQPCYTPKLSEADIASLLKYIFADKYSCLSEVEEKTTGTYKTNLSLSCAGPYWSESLSHYRSAPRIRFGQIANQIVVHDNLFNMSEGELVSVLAHEAGHYYRAHGLSNIRPLNFFYRLNDKHNLSKRPTPVTVDEQVIELGEKVTSNKARYFSLFSMPSQKWHSFIYFGFFGRVTGLIRRCENATCTTNCRAFAKHMEAAISMSPKPPLGRFPIEPAPKTEAAKTYYKNFENLMEQCTGSIPINSNNELDIGSWFEQWPLTEYIALREPLAEETLLKAVAKLNSEAAKIIGEKNEDAFSIFRKADAAKLGFYTAEQEADELSLELLTRLGIDPKHGITAFIYLDRSMEQHELNSVKIPGVLSPTECEKAYKAGFPNFIPVGDYYDLHHTSCYRSYNLWREMKAHDQEIKALKPAPDAPKLDPALWGRLINQKI